MHVRAAARSAWLRRAGMSDQDFGDVGRSLSCAMAIDVTGRVLLARIGPQL